MPKRTTIREIAELAGVSPGTVYKILHNKGNVSNRSKAAVDKVLASTGYTSDEYFAPTAKACRIAVLAPAYTVGDYWSRIYEGIRDAVKQSGYPGVTLDFFLYNQFDVYSCLAVHKLLLEKRPDAVIIDPSYLKTVPDKIKHNGYADIIRLGILGNLNILIELVKDGNVREFLNHTYALRHSINETSPKLLNLGNELAAAIEGYFRFMNYSDGEALALSLMSCVEEKSRGPLAKIYEMLGLPVKLEGVSTRSIMKILKENLARNGSGTFEVVDISDDEPRRWMIKKVTMDEACEIFAKRLEVIKSDAEGSGNVQT